MKCPKCGFNSFEYYDSCKKCFNDLTGFKQTHSIDSMVLPQEVKEKLAAEFRAAESATAQVSNSAEAHDDIFSFDLPDSSSLPAQGTDDPFIPYEPSVGENQPGSSRPEDDLFADLLESTSQIKESLLATKQAIPVSAPAVVKDVVPSSGPGEFDLESFSWDETPVATTAPDSTEIADDFDSLFRDTKDNSSK